MLITSLKRGLFVAIIASFSLCAYAEDAPVYDVDSYPPQFDGSQQDAQAGMPPAPERPQIQSEAQSQQMGPQGPSQSDQPMQQDAQSGPIAPPVSQPLPPKMDDMQSQLQALKGQVDELNHQLQQMQNQQKSMYTDLDKRINQKGSSTSAAPQPSAEETVADADSNTPAGTIKPKAKPKKVAAVTKTTTTTTTAAPAAGTKLAAVSTSDQPGSAEEQQLYQTAYGLIKAKKYSDAAQTLQGMLKKYPSGQFASNAHYWLGELYGLMGKNDQAASEFGIVVKNYPESPKIADAQLKLGLLYAAQFKWPDAKSAFKLVMNNYPGTSSARLAAEQLKQIKTAGH
jgi:tol-pal system protein YbgF